MRGVGEGGHARRLAGHGERAALKPQGGRRPGHRDEPGLWSTASALTRVESVKTNAPDAESVEIENVHPSAQTLGVWRSRNS